jgi:MFS family permease
MSTDAAAVEPYGRARERWTILACALFAWTITNMDQSLFGYAVPDVAKEFGVGLETIGLMLTVSFVVAAVLVVFAGLAADRYGRRWTLAALLSASAFLVGLHAFVDSIEALTIVRALAFGLSAGLAPITAAYVAEAAPDRIRGVMMGLLQCGYPLGWFIASLVAVPALAGEGWRQMFLVGFVVVPLAFLLAWRLPESGRFRAAASLRGPRRSGGLDTTLLRDMFGPEYRRITIASIVMFLSFGCAYAGTAFYFPAFFMEVRGYTSSEAAWLVGLSNGIAVLGYMSAAFVGEYLITRRNTFVIWCVLGALALLALLWLPRERWHDVALFALTTSFFYGTNAVLGSLVTDIYPTRMRGTAYAVCGSAPLSIGFAVYPALVPLAVGASGWQPALTMLVVPMLAVSACAALMLPNLASGRALAD